MPRQNLEPPHYDGVQSLAMKDKYLFSGSRDNTIKRWNFTNHRLEEVAKHFYYHYFIVILVLDIQSRKLRT